MNIDEQPSRDERMDAAAAREKANPRQEAAQRLDDDIENALMRLASRVNEFNKNAKMVTDMLLALQNCVRLMPHGINPAFVELVQIAQEKAARV